ncbi:MAG TPA: hypothetical protein IAC03_04215 [Candidatus Coprenecus pullistercoris]|nr:hypothetical protein [Candidatus Coprenecus pullistercoris]
MRLLSRQTVRMTMLSALSFLAAVSCVKDEETPAAPEIIIDTETASGIVVDASGGVYGFSYTVNNPSDGTQLFAQSDDAWIHDFEYEPGKVAFTVDENTDKSGRSSVLRLFYEKADVVEVTLTQLPSEGAVFEFVLRDMTSTGVTIDVLPSDKTVYYTWNILDKATADELYADDAALTAFAYDVLDQELEDYRNYVDQNGTLADILSRADDLLRVNVLDPGTEYQIFAFGVDEKSGVRNTGITRYDFSTPEFRVQDDCGFEISFDEVLQTEMTFTVVPGDPATGYYVGVCPSAMVDSEGLDGLALQFIRQADVAGIDWGSHSALNYGEMTLNTFDDMGITDMTPGMSYAVLVFGVSGLGERTTEVACAEQVLPEVMPSDMTFGITLEAQTESGAVLKIVPSVKDEPYIAGCLQYEQYSEYIGKDEEFMQYIVDYGGMGVYEGDQILDRSTALIPDTRYVCFAFGYSGGVTTPLTVFEFMTGKPDVGGSASVAFTNVEIIDGSEVGYDGKAAVYAYMTPNDEAAHWYAQVLVSENGVCMDVFGNTFSDTELISLLTDPDNAAKYTDSDYAATAVDWETELTFFAIAEDAEGNLGPLVKKTVVAQR